MASSPDDPANQTKQAPEENASEAVVETTECPNCGRVFTGTYCPDCGQEADPSVSVTDVLGGFFRELADTEGGLWNTLVGLTMRPGKALSRYLGGARKGLLNPGRYLLVACTVYFAAHWGLTQSGLEAPPSSQIPQTDHELLGPVISDILVGVVGSQEYHFAYGLVAVGFLALLLWRLFRDELKKGAEAVALASFLIGHTLILVAGVRLVYISGVYLITGRPVGVPFLLSIGATVGYPAAAIWSYFGGGWWNLAKGAFSAIWTFVDLVSLGAAIFMGYGIWLGRTYPDKYVSYEIGIETFVDVLFTAGILCSVPLLLHLWVEGYYRLVK